MTDPANTSRVVVIKTASAWIDQAKAADTHIRALAAEKGITLNDIASMHPVDPAAFGRLIEAMYALQQVGGPAVGADLVQLAGLRDVEEVLFADD